ncbi:MAG: aminotransferase class III-fold pyridoxal phosphate-dependent enzyme [Bacteroidota bacterium]
MARLLTHLSEGYNREFYRFCLTENYPFVVDLRGCHGSYLRTVEGQEILDWAGFYGSKMIAYNHPRLYEREYLDRLILAANNKVPNPDFFTPECLAFYRTLYEHAPGCMKSSPDLEVYAVNSGAEAIENMLKYLIAKHNRQAGGRYRHLPKRFIFFRNSFHGRTVFALSVTNIQKDVVTGDFHPLYTHNLPATFPACRFSADGEGVFAAANAGAVERSLFEIERYLEHYRGQVVAIVVEPIQSAGGHHVSVPRFFRELSALAAEHDVYLALDEVQTGLGLTGRPYAVDHFDLVRPPQAVAVAKKMGVGAVFMLDHLEDVGVLDSTWGGPLVDMVRVTQELRVVDEEGLIEAAAPKGEAVRRRLWKLAEEFPHLLENVRGYGLMLGFTVPDPERRGLRDLLVRTALEEELLLLLEAGFDSIRLRPNLSVTWEEIDEFFVRLRNSLVRMTEAESG